MVRRPREMHRRKFTDDDKGRLLARLRDLRSEMTAVGERVPYGDPLYRALDVYRDGIDTVAEAITGDRTYFWVKPH